MKVTFASLFPFGLSCLSGQHAEPVAHAVSPAMGACRSCPAVPASSSLYINQPLTPSPAVPLLPSLCISRASNLTFILE